ncbi:hypothetical protein SteCoe_16348 [Stentor coeruleus]|uniref:Uncharacterized protein n=1 Tax=Stentor coeruleus TaxID=5963 RepID=A0A1R2C1L9_9CILI|nr:hypothetical protein SteCoe_16348 [Stentor coeruleus]
MKILNFLTIACIFLQVSTAPTSFLQDEESDSLAEEFESLLEVEDTANMTVEELEILLDSGYELLDSLDNDETVTISGDDYDEEQLEDLIKDLEEDLAVQEAEDEISDILAECLQEDGSYLIPEDMCGEIIEIYQDIEDYLDDDEAITVDGVTIEESDIEALILLYEFTDFDYLVLYEDGTYEIIE